MPSVIGLSASWEVCQVIGMCISNEIVLNLIEFVFIVIILVFILVDFSLDIEELIAAFSSAFSTMSLDSQVNNPFVCHVLTADCGFVAKMLLSAYCNLLFVIFLFLLVFLLIVISSRSIFAFSLIVFIIRSLLLIRAFVS